MKISPCFGPRMSKIYLRPSPVRHRKASTFRLTGARRDAVLLSPRVRELRKLAELVKDIPDVRQDKIQAIKKQIRSGSYKASADSVAESIINLHRKIYSDTE